jgi:hypothetical protein
MGWLVRFLRVNLPLHPRAKAPGRAPDGRTSRNDQGPIGGRAV